MIRFEDLSIRRGPSLLLEDFSCQLHYGHKVAVTGANGCGKSSLFAMILGQLEADTGQFRLPTDWVIAHVAQETPQTSQPSLQYVLDGDEELAEVTSAIEKAQAEDDTACLPALYERLENIGGYDAASRAGKLMHGLGFTAADAARPVSDLSGGWRVRLNLARALMCRSDLLLLDEPNNHLDLDAVIWLESWLIAYPGTLLLISHDRDFLDRVAATTVAMEGDGRAVVYAGGWSDYQSQRPEDGASDTLAKQVKAKGDKPKAAPKTGLTFTEKHRLDALPAEIERLEAEIGKLEGLLSDPELFTREPIKFKKATEALVERQKKLSDAEEEWLILEDKA